MSSNPASSRVRSRSRSCRRLPSSRDRAEPLSGTSDRPPRELGTIFTGHIVPASALMCQPRLAVFALRHLESRCDAFVSSLDSLDAAFRASCTAESRPS